MQIQKAERNNLEQILELQYLAYQSEAKLLNNYSIQPLTQTLDELQQEYENGIILKAVNEDGSIVGSVRCRVEGNTVFIGKLIVHPDCQGKGIGSSLLQEVEKLLPNLRYELFTSSKSTKNLQMYERIGYKRFKEVKVMPELNMIYLEK